MGTRRFMYRAVTVIVCAAAGLALAPLLQAETSRPYRVTEERAPCSDYHPLRRPHFGDTHVHTSFSFDASAQDTRNDPAEASTLR